ncbi:hypothetical protein SXANM310S_04319 [Streptomyces xanthochromogenes]
MSSKTTAVAVGVRRTWASNSSWAHCCGISTAVSFHSTRSLCRSSAESTSRWPGIRFGSAATASSRRTSRAAIASIVARSNRSVA